MNVRYKNNIVFIPYILPFYNYIGDFLIILVGIDYGITHQLSIS